MNNAAVNDDFTVVSGHNVPPGTGVRHRHSDGTTTTAETATSLTIPQPVFVFSFLCGFQLPAQTSWKNTPMMACFS
eukprot:3500675-Amphidinium_carterae.1